MRYPGEQTPHEFFRDVDQRLAKLERGDLWRGGTMELAGVNLAGLVIHPVVNESDGSVALSVVDSETGRSGTLGIIWNDQLG